MFIKELHLYLDEKGNPVPCVSQIIDAVCGNDFEFVSQENLENPCRRGTAVHLSTELLDKGLTPTITEETAPYILAYKSLNLPEWTDIEKSFHYKGEYQYCGTADRLSKDGVYDIKTSSAINKLKWGMQLTAYAYALDKRKICALHLKANGTGKLVELNPLMTEEWEAALIIFYTFHYKKWAAKAKKDLRELQVGELF